MVPSGAKEIHRFLCELEGCVVVWYVCFGGQPAANPQGSQLIVLNVLRTRNEKLYLPPKM